MRRQATAAGGDRTSLIDKRENEYMMTKAVQCQLRLEMLLEQ